LTNQNESENGHKKKKVETMLEDRTLKKLKSQLGYRVHRRKTNKYCSLTLLLQQSGQQMGVEQCFGNRGARPQLVVLMLLLMDVVVPSSLSASLHHHSCPCPGGCCRWHLLLLLLLLAFQRSENQRGCRRPVARGAGCGGQLQQLVLMLLIAVAGCQRQRRLILGRLAEVAGLSAARYFWLPPEPLLDEVFAHVHRSWGLQWQNLYEKFLHKMRTNPVQSKVQAAGVAHQIAVGIPSPGGRLRCAAIAAPGDGGRSRADGAFDAVLVSTLNFDVLLTLHLKFVQAVTLP
jgi:hypothetical protein